MLPTSDPFCPPDPLLPCLCLGDVAEAALPQTCMCVHEHAHTGPEIMWVAFSVRGFLVVKLDLVARCLLYQ